MMLAISKTLFYSDLLPPPAGAVDWRAVDGTIRSRRRTSGRVTYYIDFSPLLTGADRKLTSYMGVTLDTHQDAELLQQRIQALRASGKTLREAVDAYRQPKNRRNRVDELVGRWVEWLIQAEELEPYTLRSYRGHVNKQFRWWGNRTIDQLNWDLLYEWSQWMRAEGLAPKTVINVLATMRSFLRWHQMRHSEFVIPPFPTVKRAKKKKPVTMPLLDQAAAIAAIPEADRGIFLAYAHLTVRQGEGRACLVEHYDFKRRELWIGDAMKGDNSRAPRGDTKTGECGRYPVSDELAQWIERFVPDAARFRGGVPLFPNPRTGRIYSRKTIQQIWRDACERAEVEFVPPYRATKHSTLSELARVLSAEQLQGLARHKDFRTTREYLGEDADPKGEAQAARAKLLEEKGGAKVRRIATTERDSNRPGGTKKSPLF